MPINIPNRITNESSLGHYITFDEMPCIPTTTDSIDWIALKKYFSGVGKEFSKNTAKELKIIVTHDDKEKPSNGGILLFGKARPKIFSNATIRCTYLAGKTKRKIVDCVEINTHLPDVVDAVMHFINKKAHINTLQYPEVAIREAVINALLHTDYAIKDSFITVSLFADRIEITNPGELPYGFSLKDALDGSSRYRNRVIARVFRTLHLSEQWGSGMQKIIQSCAEHGLREPKFEELKSQFRVTLFAQKNSKSPNMLPSNKDSHGAN